MVNVGSPTGVDEVVATVRVLEPAPVIEDGTKRSVAPLGRPLALKAIDPLKPLSAVVVTVYVVLLP